MVKTILNLFFFFSEKQDFIAKNCKRGYTAVDKKEIHTKRYLRKTKKLENKQTAYSKKKSNLRQTRVLQYSVPKVAKENSLNSKVTKAKGKYKT